VKAREAADRAPVEEEAEGASQLIVEETKNDIPLVPDAQEPHHHEAEQ